MKKISAVILGIIFSLSLFVPVVSGSSANSINKTRTVRDNTEITDVYLKITPRDEVATGDTIFLTYKNAEVLDIPQFGSVFGGGETWESLENSLVSEGSMSTLDSLWSRIGSNYLPWNISRLSKTMLKVELFPIPDPYCNRNVGKNDSVPFYSIPLHVLVSHTGGNEISVYLDSNSTSISSGTYVFGNMPLEASDKPEAEKATEKTETTTEDYQAATDAASETVTDTASVSKRVPLSVRVAIGSNSVMVDDRVYTMDVAPYIQTDSSSTLVPLRFVALAICGENIKSADASEMILWDAETKTAEIRTLDGNSICFTAGSNIMTINGDSVAMDNGVRAEITDGRIFIPFRALGNALGVGVSWDSETKTAIYSPE